MSSSENSSWDRVIDYAARHGLSTHALALYVNLAYWGYTLYGIQPQQITSGKRTQSQQAELLNRWLRGDPGVAVRPADDSRHLTGDAFDLGMSTTRTLDIYAWIAYRVGISGTRWGGNFRPPDPIHFDCRGL